MTQETFTIQDLTMRVSSDQTHATLELERMRERHRERK